MSYTSPSPANVAINGNQTTWWIPAQNLSAVKATNVAVQVSISPANGLMPVTYIADKGVFNFTTGIWQVGELLPGEIRWLKIVTSVADIGLAPFTLTSTITGSGIDPNNVNNVKVQTVTSVVTSATAGAVNDPNSCYCGDVSLNDTICNFGTTEWVLDPTTVVNSDVYTWDNATGKYRFTPISLTQDITASYSIWCDDVEISGPATLTIPALIDDVTQFNHTIVNKTFAELSNGDKSVLEAQYPGTDLEGFCWTLLYNGAGEPTSGIPLNCNDEQDTRTFFVCVEAPCTPEDGDCPCALADLPVGVEAALPVGYSPEKGDTIVVKHPGAESIWVFNGTSYERTSCGCIEVASPIESIAFTGTGTKTLTITFKDGSTKTATFTDISGGSGEDTDTTYTFEVVDNDLVVTSSEGDIQTVPLPEGGGSGDGWGTQVIRHADCSPSSGDGTLANPLEVNIPTPSHVFNNTALEPSDTATIVDVAILFSAPCPGGCTATYTLGGYSTLVYENVVLTGSTLTYDVKADAPAGNAQIIINRNCA